MDRHPDNLPQDLSVDFLLDLYARLPVLIVRLTVDGLVLGMNPHVAQVTGFSAEDLLGRNFWATLFPGRLFAQVPRFISPTHPDALLRDYPLTVRTAAGAERIIAWTRFLRTDPATARKEIVLVGQDLTDRLTDADRAAADEGLDVTAADAHATVSPDDGDAALVLPLAITPPATSDAETARAIREVHDFLSLVETRMQDLHAAYEQGQVNRVAALADQLKLGAHACGLLNVSRAADALHHAAARGGIESVTQHVTELMEMCRQRGQQTT